MNQPTPEQVLVISRSLFTEHEPFIGFKRLDETTPDLGVYLQGAPQKNAQFMDRAEAEKSPFFKQIIPYIVLLSEDKIFMYRRGEVGSEARLHGQYSIGIGGHINPEDGEEPFWAFANGACREAMEEVGLQLDVNMIGGSAIGLVNDESNQVGSVHLGVVLAIKLAAVAQEQIVKAAENTMLEAQWIPLYELEAPELRPRLETWSGFVAEHFIKELSKDGKWDDKAFRERVGLLSIAASNLASSATSLLMQESPRGHMLGKGLVEEAAGETQCMLAGLIAHDDIHGHEVKRCAKEFHADLARIVKHQPVTEQIQTEKL